MFSKDMLVGILLSCAKVQFKIIRTDELKIGYKPIVGLSIRGKAKFLHGVQRSLLHWGVYSSYHNKESSSRPKPIVYISGIRNLEKVINNIPDNLESRRGEWETMDTVVKMLVNKEHLTQKGLDKLLELKGVI
jgi:hypothetical protein